LAGETYLSLISQAIGQGLIRKGTKKRHRGHHREERGGKEKKRKERKERKGSGGKTKRSK